MGENPSNHGGIFNRGDDFQGAATAMAVLIRGIIHPDLSGASIITGISNGGYIGYKQPK